MARISRKARAQRTYRSRKARYAKYLATTKSQNPKTYEEWVKPINERTFLRKEYKLYKEMFEKRKKSAMFGFRLGKSEEGDYIEDVKAYSFTDFKEEYATTRTDLEEEVEAGERKRIGSVITEMINDQAYELSRPKTRGILEYAMREKPNLLIDRDLAEWTINEKGEKVLQIIKPKKVELLIRQGQWVRDELGLWDSIKAYYRAAKAEKKSVEEIKNEISQSFFKS